VAQKYQNLTPFLYALTLSDINRFLKLFYCQNQDKICSNTITKDPTTHQVSLVATCEMSSVLKATIENMSEVKRPTLIVTKFFIN